MAVWYISVAGAGTKTGTSVENAFSGATGNLALLLGNGSNGDIFYIESGTYGKDVDFSWGNATALLPRQLIGVRTLSGLEPAFGTDRPFFNQPNHSWFITGNSWIIKNLRFNQALNSSNYVIGIGSLNFIENVSVTTSGVAVGILSRGSVTRMINCEVVATSGIGFSSRSADMYLGCYVHDSVTGFLITQGGSLFNSCIADACTTGFSISASQNSVILKNLVSYACTTGINLATGVGAVSILSSILSNCGKGIYSANTHISNLVKNNCYYNNSVANVEGIQLGDNAVESDPLFVDAINGNFSLQATSPCINAGMGMKLGVG